MLYKDHTGYVWVVLVDGCRGADEMVVHWHSRVGMGSVGLLGRGATDW